MQALTFKSKCIRVDRNLFDFLLEDGIYIHPKYLKSAATHPAVDAKSNGNSNDAEPDCSNANANTENNNHSTSYHSNSSVTFREFSPEFESAFANALEEFDGSLFVKLAWRAPRDTENWLLGLEITNMEDLLTALKSSGILTDILEDYEKLFEISDPASLHNDNIITVNVASTGEDDSSNNNNNCNDLVGEEN